MKYIVWIIVLALIIWGAVALFGGDAKEAEAGPIKIGLSAPLTGEAASLGEPFAAGARLAVSEINEAGGIDGRMVELFVEDDECSAKGVNAITKLVEIDKVVAIAGPLCSAAAGPGLPVAQEGNVPAVIVASAPHLTMVGDAVYRVYPSDSFQGKFIAEHLYNELGKRKAAVVYVKNDWGQGLNDVFSARFAELGGEVVYSDGAAQDTTDIRTLITKAKDADPDVVYAPLYPATGVAAIKQFKEILPDLDLVGGDAWSTEEIWSLPEADGLIYTQAHTNNPESFQDSVLDSTGVAAATYTPYAYDAVMVLAAAIDKADSTDPDAIKAALASLNYSDSVAVPNVSFDENGDLASAVFDIMVVKDGSASPLMGEMMDDDHDHDHEEGDDHDHE